MRPFLDAPNPAVPALRGNLLPLSDGLPRHATAIAANVAALGPCEELPGCRGYVSETRVIRDLHAIGQSSSV